MTVLTSCTLGSSSDSAATATPSPSQGTGNGSLYVTQVDDTSASITRHAIDADGNLGPAIPIVSGPSDGVNGPVVIDGIAGTVAVGQFTDYWSTTVELRDAETGEPTGSVDAPQWCGGEGLTYNPCALASAQVLVRTSELGDPTEPEATLWVTSLTDGTDAAEWGPIRNLRDIYATTDPDVMLITVAASDPADPPQSTAGSVEQFNPDSGESQTIGTYQSGWLPICPLGSGALLGWAPDSDTAAGGAASVVGDATIGDIMLPDQARPIGCSADGEFLYYERGGGQEPTVITRVALADGASTTVLTQDEGSSTTVITR